MKLVAAALNRFHGLGDTQVVTSHLDRGCSKQEFLTGGALTRQLGS